MDLRWEEPVNGSSMRGPALREYRSARGSVESILRGFVCSYSRDAGKWRAYYWGVAGDLSDAVVFDSMTDAKDFVYTVVRMGA